MSHVSLGIAHDGRTLSVAREDKAQTCLIASTDLGLMPAAWGGQRTLEPEDTERNRAALALASHSTDQSNGNYRRIGAHGR